MSRQHARPAFGLGNLIILLAVVALIFALLLPALQRLRQRASQSVSMNNLKQIGIACHGYHDTTGNLPAGMDKDGNSAAVHLLPYIEQDNLFKKFATAGRGAIEGERVAVYEDPRETVKTVTEGLAPTSYLFNAGTKFALKENDGVAYLESKERLQNIPDGTSNTVLAGETMRGSEEGEATVQRRHVRYKAGTLKGLADGAGVDDFAAGKNLAANRCASWADGHFLQGTYTATLRPNAPAPDVDCGGIGGISALRTPDNVVLLLLCDGSVRNVSVKVSAETWKAAHGRNDGLVLGSDF